jgi:SAM-dependent methyltransferase
MSKDLAYAGRDLEAMSFAVNYHRWILERFKPFLGRRVTEVGAGTGLFSRMLMNYPLESLTLVEPSDEMYAILRETVERFRGTMPVETYNAVFIEVADEIRRMRRPDSIIYVNVLEHIADDETELRVAYETLEEKGKNFIFVPAFEWLFGPLDKQLGHYRRYRMQPLLERCVSAGFKVLEANYMDLLGVAPWWIKYRLFKSTSIEPALVNLYDKYLVWLTRGVENAITPPFGKNILLIAQK